MSEVVNFLADLFKQGYQYRSLNAYRSAISSVHDRVEGVAVGQHPLVSRLLKGVFNLRPPQPRYTSTWDVSQVLAYLEGLGENSALPLQMITLKLVMLMALTRPTRAADLQQLDLRFRRYLPEGVKFQASGLAKQTRANKPIADFFFPGFTQKEKLCPVTTLKAYEKATEQFRKTEEQQKLFIATIRPHKPVAASTIARWLRTVLERAGIDTTIFKAHSTRGASVSAAANAGITTSEIMQSADWSSESTFKRFYYKPVQSAVFGETILSHAKSTSST